MEKIKISAVSYVNTFPFLYGIDNKLNKDSFDVSTDVPSECARKLIDNEVDIGLIPVAAIPKLNNPHIISDYCIGATGTVKSVLLVSQKPVKDISKVYLDSDSRSSVNLFKVLAKNYWKKNFIYEKIDSKSSFQELPAAVIIGDKTFNVNGFKYVYDLSEEWQKFSGLPFVFATWVSNKKLPENLISDFNKALGFGIDNIELSLEIYCKDMKNKDFYLDYLSNNIDYNFDNKKRLAMNKFLKYL